MSNIDNKHLIQFHDPIISFPRFEKPPVLISLLEEAATLPLAAFADYLEAG